MFDETPFESGDSHPAPEPASSLETAETIPAMGEVVRTVRGSEWVPAQEADPSAIADGSDNTGAPWDFLDLVFTLMIVLGSLFMAEALMAAGLAAFLATHVAGAGHAGPRVSDLLSEVRFQLPVQFVSYALTVWFVLLTARVKYQRSLGEALQWRTLGPSMWAFLPAGVVLALAAQLIPVLFPSSKTFPIEKMVKDPISGWSMAVFGVCIAPFVEEMFFRGMIYPVIAKRWGLESAVLVSALLFASIHSAQLAGALPELGAIFLVGVAFGYVRGRSGSLVPGFLMHTAYNATLFAAIIVGTKGFHDFPR
jgi:membrane protease YdiL (CAAX protease family)